MLPLLLAMATSQANSDPGLAEQAIVAARPFDLAEVRLLPSPFRRAMDANAKYLLALEPNRLLHGFRKNAGLEPKAERYGGWESQGVAGHTLGHYLTALSLQYRASGDLTFKERAHAIVDELAECQQSRGDGYIGAIPNAEPVWEQIRRGDIRSQGFDLNGLWVPWYTHHKVLAGLIDAHRLTSSDKALGVAKRFADWMIDLTKNLSEDQWQAMLACEHGGMNESLAELYAITKDARYWDLSRRFHHRAILDPLEQGRDELQGKHANTQVPKVIGVARQYELGQATGRKIAEFFWNTVVRDHSYVNGGNSDHEHFGPPRRLRDRLSMNTSETCNTYNMLKLTSHLFGWSPKAAYADYAERALFNHILASQNPEDGMVCYYVPLVSGAHRPHSTPFDSFWCCVGTGIENHAKYGEYIYYKAGERLYVNQFIPSEVTWAEKHLKLRMEADFARSSLVRLTVLQAPAGALELAVRRPSWLEGTPRAMVNGAFSSIAPGDFMVFKRTWREGDVLELQLPMKLRSENMPDDPNRIALFYGPILLAADLGPVAAPAPRTPVLVPGERPLEQWLARKNNELVWTTVDAAKPADLTLRPFFELHESRYAVYFDRFTHDQWARQEEEYRAEERRQAELEARTIDRLRIGEMQPERDHNLQGERTQSGEFNGRKWRHAVDGGWFSFDLKVDPAAPVSLLLTYWGSDSGGREFDVLVDGRVVGTEVLAARHPGKFFEVEYRLPQELTTGRAKIAVRLQAKPGRIAGGLFDARIVRAK